MVVSGTAYDQLQGKLDLPLEFAGEQRVKNIERPVGSTACGSTVRRPGSGVATSAAAGAVPRRPWLVLLARRRRLVVVRGGLPGRGRPPCPTGPRSPCCRSTTWAATSGRSGFADGITEDIITDLARFREPARHRPQLDLRLQGQAGRRAPGRPGARRALRARGQRPARRRRLRVTAQLIDAATGAHVWSER